jgi:hypothetical protein
MKEEWLMSGAVVPVDVETTAALVAEIHRLIDVVGGMALAQHDAESHLQAVSDFGQLQEQEPVGRFAKFTDGIWREVTEGSAGVPLHTSPPKREWVGLSEVEVDNFHRAAWSIGVKPAEFIRAIEAKLKAVNGFHSTEKNK